jgi:hypothetical protein
MEFFEDLSVFHQENEEYLTKSGNVIFLFTKNEKMTWWRGWCWAGVG